MTLIRTWPAFSASPPGIFTVAAALPGAGIVTASTRVRNSAAVAKRSSGDFSSDFGPGYRAVYDLADLNRSRFMLAPGQSGHILSPHYRDLAPLWARGEGIEIAGDWPADKPPEGMTVLTLSPAPKAR